MFFAVLLRIPDSQQTITGFFIDLILSILAEILSTGILMERGILPLSYSCGVLTSIMTAPFFIASLILFFPNKKPNMLIFFFHQFAGATLHNTILFLPIIFHDCLFPPLLLFPIHKFCQHA